jgi:Zn-dependent protease with chaperone function
VTSATPTILALETASAWVVILTVSCVTLVAALVLRRLIGRPGSFASGILLTLPLVLPLIAAGVYARQLLPEVEVLAPAGRAFLQQSQGSTQVILFSERGDLVVPLAVQGSAGPWLLLLGLSVSSFMLVRRLLGALLLRGLIRRCRVPSDHWIEMLAPRVRAMSEAAGLKRPPEVMFLPPKLAGVFAVGTRRARILICEELLEELDPEELDCILAHEVAHVEARDIQLVFIAGMLRDVVAWNPLAHAAYRRLVLDRELEADRRAVAFTGDALSLASGLLKVCATMGSGRGVAQRAAVAFIKPGSRIKRRIKSILALADGRAVPMHAQRLPYLFAAAAVALLGMQAGARLASQESSALSLVWGTPTFSTADLWSPAVKGKGERRRAKREKPVPKGEDLARPLRTKVLRDYVAFKERHLPQWLRNMRRLVGRELGVTPSTLRMQSRNDWRAVPLFSQPPFGIYRMKLQTIGNASGI